MNFSQETLDEFDTQATVAAADAHETLQRERLVAEAVADGRKLVTVREISAIDDIPGADLIKVATVEGWKVVVRTGEFKPGDLCCFFEVDCFLPFSDSRYEFLRKNGITWNGIEGARLKTIRLRKQLSQGLALPVREFPELKPYLNDPGLRDINFTGILKVMKWEKPMSAQLAGQAKGNFPSWLKKSEQERANNMVRAIFGYEDEHDTTPLNIDGIPEEVLVDMMGRGELIALGGNVNGPNYYRVRKAAASRDTRYEVTLKLDGSSMTAYHYVRDGEVLEGVCSRNLDLKLNEDNKNNSFIRTYFDTTLNVALARIGRNIAVQGELMGPSVQGNRENLLALQFFVYNIFDIDKREFMTPSERKEMMDLIQSYTGGLVQHVPVLHASATLEELGIRSMDDLLAFADGPSMNNSVREGLVFKAEDGRHQFKVISNQFLEAEK